MNRLTVEALPAVAVTAAGADFVRGLGSADGLSVADRAALTGLGVLDLDGAPTRMGRRLRDDLRDADLALLFEQADGASSRRGRLYVGRRRLMYVAAPDAGADSADVMIFPADAVPVLLARWGRLGPSGGTPATLGATVDRSVFTRRCGSAAEPLPTDAEPDLALLWAGTWRLWGVQCDLRGVSLTYLDVDGLGTFAVRGTEDGAVSLAARPSSLLWGDLQGVWSSLDRSAGAA